MLGVYLAGEIHTNWREEIADGAQNLNVMFTAPVTDHEASDDCGVKIMGSEQLKFWHDHKGAKLNAIRTRRFIEEADVIVVRFGEKYKQWNAAFEAGYAAALGKSIIVKIKFNIFLDCLLFPALQIWIMSVYKLTIM